MFSLSSEPASVIRPAEMKVWRMARAPSWIPSDGRGRGSESSETKSLMKKSLVWTLSSSMPSPLITALVPRREIFMRYWREDCVWA